jgi:hypothetical protein
VLHVPLSIPEMALYFNFANIAFQSNPSLHPKSIMCHRTVLPPWQVLILEFTAHSQYLMHSVLQEIIYIRQSKAGIHLVELLRTYLNQVNYVGCLSQATFMMIFSGCCEHGNELLESLIDKQYLDS